MNNLSVWETRLGHGKKGRDMKLCEVLPKSMAESPEHNRGIEPGRDSEVAHTRISKHSCLSSRLAQWMTQIYIGQDPFFRMEI